jgi:hypothetical protein
MIEDYISNIRTVIVGSIAGYMRAGGAEFVSPAL